MRDEGVGAVGARASVAQREPRRQPHVGTAHRDNWKTHDFMGVACLYRWQVANILFVSRRMVNYLADQGRLPFMSNPIAVWKHYPIEDVRVFADSYIKWGRCKVGA